VRPVAVSPAMVGAGVDGLDEELAVARHGGVREGCLQRLEIQ
jgi:hypothetical protein